MKTWLYCVLLCCGRVTRGDETGARPLGTRRWCTHQATEEESIPANEAEILVNKIQNTLPNLLHGFVVVKLRVLELESGRRIPLLRQQDPALSLAVQTVTKHTNTHIYTRREIVCEK